jgi:maleylpyruvate isomerase
MSVDPLVLLPDIDRATGRLLATARTLDDRAVAAPSLLAGWSRGHVLSHVARNADAAVRLLTSARTGDRRPQYASVSERDADIEAGADRPAGDHVTDVAASAARIDEAVAQMAPESWAAPVDWLSGRSTPAAFVMWARLREVEVHHVDLDAGYTPGDWPAPFVHRLLHELAADLAGAMVPARLRATDLDHELTIGADPAVTVSGPGFAIAGWLAGRGVGAGLTAGPTGPLPTVPIWR